MMTSVGALVQVVQLGADAQEKIVGAVELPALGFVEELLLDQAGGGLHALLEEADPEQVLVIAQAAAAVLDIGFLQINGAAVLLVALGLVLDALGNVLVHAGLDAFLDETGLNFANRASSPAMKRASSSAVLDCMSSLACLTAPEIERVEWPTLKPTSQSM